MTCRALACAAALCITLPALAVAQPSAPRSRPQGAKPPAPARPNASAEGRRAMAVSLLTSLGNEARNFRDPKLRARVQARVASSLWDADAEAARVLFRHAWSAAEAVDGETRRRAAQELAELPGSAAAGKARATAPTNLRGEVLRLAAACDTKLADEFLDQLAQAAGPETTPAPAEGSAINCAGALEGTPAEASRLELAGQLLQGGDAERALLMAGPSLGRVTTRSVSFLSLLRHKSPAEADARYLALLARAAGDPCADANTALIVSSYVFTPNFFITLNNGLNTIRYGGSVSAPDLSADARLRRAFFLTAAQILARPLPPADQVPTARQRALFFAITRLLPLFEQHAPELTDGLRQQLVAVAAPQTSQPFRAGRGLHLLTAGLVPESKAVDEVQEQLGQLERALTTGERDFVYAKAAQLAAARGEERAREFVEKIENGDLRRQVRSYVDFLAVRRAIEKKDAAEVLRLARAAEITQVQRVWALTEGARLLKQEDAARAAQVLDDALVEARRIAEADPNRVRGLLAVATHFHELDRDRTWEVLAEVVEAAGKAADFSGEDGEVTARMQTKTLDSTTSSSVPSFNLNGIFGRLARDDMGMAVAAAQSFAAEAPRSVALISIARAVLNEGPQRAAGAK